MLTSWCLDRHPIASRNLARCCTHLCFRLTALRTTSAYLLNCETVCGDLLRHRFPMTSWVCQWKQFWSPVGDTFHKAYLEEWQRVDGEFICDPGEYSIGGRPLRC